MDEVRESFRKSAELLILELNSQLDEIRRIITCGDGDTPMEMIESILDVLEENDQ